MDEVTDVKTEPVVETPAVSQPDTGANGVVLADGQNAADKTVPYSRFEEANAAANAAKEEAATLRAQMNLQAQQQASVPQNQPTDPYSQTLRSLGLQDESYLTVEQQGQVFNAMFQNISVQQADAAFMESHPDYAQVVGSADATGRFVPAAPLQRVLANDPQLGPAINNSPQGKRLAYKIAIADPEYQASLKKAGQTPEVQAAADAKAIVEAAARQASISAAGSGQGNINKAEVVANMNDEEFRVYKEEIMSRAV